MKLDSLKRRIEALVPEGGICPRCPALEAMSEEDFDVRIQALASGQSVLADLPDPSPSCPRCQRSATMSEEELDEELNRLLKILGYAKQHEMGQDEL